VRRHLPGRLSGQCLEIHQSGHMHLDQDTRGKWLAHAEGEVSALHPPSAQPEAARGASLILPPCEAVRGPPAAVSQVLLVAGCGIAAMFFRAGRTKVEGLLTITDSTFERFRADPAVPFMNPRARGACRDLLGAPLSGLDSTDAPGEPPLSG
jgi:hypothetical protein